MKRRWPTTAASTTTLQSISSSLFNSKVQLRRGEAAAAFREKSTATPAHPRLDRGFGLNVLNDLSDVDSGIVGKQREETTEEAKAKEIFE